MNDKMNVGTRELLRAMNRASVAKTSASRENGLFGGKNVSWLKSAENWLNDKLRSFIGGAGNNAHRAADSMSKSSGRANFSRPAKVSRTGASTPRNWDALALRAALANHNGGAPIKEELTRLFPDHSKRFIGQPNLRAGVSDPPGSERNSGGQPLHGGERRNRFLSEASRTEAPPANTTDHSGRRVNSPATSPAATPPQMSTEERARRVRNPVEPDSKTRQRGAYMYEKLETASVRAALANHNRDARFASKAARPAPDASAQPAPHQDWNAGAVAPEVLRPRAAALQTIEGHAASRDAKRLLDQGNVPQRAADRSDLNRAPSRAANGSDPVRMRPSRPLEHEFDTKKTPPPSATSRESSSTASSGSKPLEWLHSSPVEHELPQPRLGPGNVAYPGPSLSSTNQSVPSSRPPTSNNWVEQIDEYDNSLIPLPPVPRRPSQLHGAVGRSTDNTATSESKYRESTPPLQYGSGPMRRVQEESGRIKTSTRFSTSQSVLTTFASTQASQTDSANYIAIQKLTVQPSMGKDTDRIDYGASDRISAASLRVIRHMESDPSAITESRVRTLKIVTDALREVHGYGDEGTAHLRGALPDIFEVVGKGCLTRGELRQLNINAYEFSRNKDVNIANRRFNQLLQIALDHTEQDSVVGDVDDFFSAEKAIDMIDLATLKPSTDNANDPIDTASFSTANPDIDLQNDLIVTFGPRGFIEGLPDSAQTTQQRTGLHSKSRQALIETVRVLTTEDLSKKFEEQINRELTDPRQPITAKQMTVLVHWLNKHLPKTETSIKLEPTAARLQN